MKRFAAWIMAGLLLWGTASAEVKFTYDAYMGFQQEETTVRIYSDGTDAGKTVFLRDESGNVLTEAVLKRGKGNQNITFVIPAGSAGIHMSLFVEDAVQASDTALLAAETRPGYSITRVERADKKLAITFDSANAASKTLKILDLLDEYGAKCTFFLQGTFIKGNPEVAQEIEARGHEVASHSYAHPEMPSLTNDQILRDFEKNSAIFNEVLGHEPVLYRPPSGYSSQRDRAIARALGQEVIKWTIDSRDGFQDSTLNTVIKRVENNAQSGDIILMHVYGKHTITALETLLPYYIGQGYELVTVSDILLEGKTAIDTDGVQHPVQE